MTPGAGVESPGAAAPVLFVTNHVPPDRVGAFRALHERVGIELALFGGRSHHATAGVGDPGVPHRRIAQRAAYRLAASGRYRAVVCGTAGRVALPAAWRGARRGGVPFVLWSALWSHPRTPAHLLAGAPLLRAIYRDADALVAYGPHVAAFARRRGARRVEIAPQAVDGAFWGAAGVAPRRPDGAAFVALHVGRPAREKGLPELLAAWRMSGLGQQRGALVLVGEEAGHGGMEASGVHAAGQLDAGALRERYAGADVVVMPSIATRSFREPWGLVANEAMHRGVPVIASDAVGAAAGGLVVHERNGLVVPAGDAGALAAALRRLQGDPALRERLGATAARDVAPYTFEAWADGFARALSLT